MTLARRTLLALCIALATALAVVGLATIETGGAAETSERLHRN